MPSTSCGGSLVHTGVWSVCGRGKIAIELVSRVSGHGRRCDLRVWHLPCCGVHSSQCPRSRGANLVGEKIVAPLAPESIGPLSMYVEGIGTAPCDLWGASFGV